MAITRVEGVTTYFGVTIKPLTLSTSTERIGPETESNNFGVHADARAFA